MMRVIKVGGRPQQDPSLCSRLARSVASKHGSTILVHGGGDEVTALQGAFGLVPTFVDGRRVTTAADIDLIRMALSGAANKRIVSTLQDHGVNAVGLSGEDGGLLVARACEPERMGLVGMPERVNVALLRTLVGAGYLPVISPVSRSADPGLSGALNVNGDDAAAAIAASLDAEELLLISDVAGVMRDGAVLSQLSGSECAELLMSDAVTGGMRAKVQAAQRAIDAGVARVRISDLGAIDDPARGTLVFQSGGAS
jgi:acetylglutamate kinase